MFVYIRVISVDSFYVLLGHHDIQRFMLKSSASKLVITFLYLLLRQLVATILYVYVVRYWQTEKLYSFRVERYISSLKVLKCLPYNNKYCILLLVQQNVFCTYAVSVEKFQSLFLRTIFIAIRNTLCICNNKEIIAQYYKCTSGKRNKGRIEKV